MENNKKPIKTVDGIPFYSEDRYWGKASSRGDLARALEILETEGWDAFVKAYPNTFDVTFEENRADWRFVIPVTKEFVVLDAGAGMGRISIPLARVVKKVVALDQSFLRAKFLKLRAEKEKLQNIEPTVGDLFDIHFEKETFDLIVMNGLVEWLGSTDRFKNPREAQIAGLRIAHDLLKKGGYLYIGIENRFAASYISGIDHSGLRFTSYMPKWLANWYMNIRMGRRYDTYIYTKRGYELLLKDSGFEDITFYLPYPGYNKPRIMIPYDQLRVFAYAIRALMPPTGVKKKIAQFFARWPVTLHIYRYVFFSYGIVVRK